MYKTQLKIQKFTCLAAIIISALVFVYALGIMTNIYDSLYQAVDIKSETGTGNKYVSGEKVAGAAIYMDMQSFNHNLLIASIVMVVLGAFLFVTNTSTRRRYYISNYIAIGLYSIVGLALTVYSHIQIQAFRTQFLTTVDFEGLKEFADMWGTLYTESTFAFDIHYLVFGLLVLVIAALIANVVWKLKLMSEEKALLAGKGAKA